MMTTDPADSRTLIQNALEALKRGDKVTAQNLARQAAEQAPEIEQPWLILAALSSPAESLEYARKALQINPESKPARQAWDWALRRLPAQPPAAEAERPPEPVQPDQPAEVEQPPETVQPPDEVEQPGEQSLPVEVEQTPEPVQPVAEELPSEQVRPGEEEQPPAPIPPPEAEPLAKQVVSPGSPASPAETPPAKPSAHKSRWILIVIAILIVLLLAGVLYANAPYLAALLRQLIPTP
jgi:hypothetical protein